MRVGTSVSPRSLARAAIGQLAPMQEQLARALRVVVLARGGPVGRDVDGVQPQLAVADRRVAVLQLGAGGAQRLAPQCPRGRSRTPGARAAGSGGTRSAIGRHVARPELALALALGHGAERSWSGEMSLNGSALAGSAGGAGRVSAGGCEVHAAANGVHARHAHLIGSPRAQRRAGALAVEDGALLVELPPLAGLLPAGTATAPGWCALEPDREHPLEDRRLLLGPRPGCPGPLPRRGHAEARRTLRPGSARLSRRRTPARSRARRAPAGARSSGRRRRRRAR